MGCEDRSSGCIDYQRRHQMGGPDLHEWSEWSRHYDSLLWQVTGLFAAGIGGLLAYSFSRYHDAIAVAGLILTCLPVYFAASFRESRDRVNKQLGSEIRQVLFEGRRLRQWPWYVSVFVILEGLWAYLLVTNSPDYRCLWFAVSTAGVVLILFCSCFGKQRGSSTVGTGRCDSGKKLFWGLVG